MEVEGAYLGSQLHVLEWSEKCDVVGVGWGWSWAALELGDELSRAIGLGRSGKGGAGRAKPNLICLQPENVSKIKEARQLFDTDFHNRGRYPAGIRAFGSCPTFAELDTIWSKAANLDVGISFTILSSCPKARREDGL